MNFKVLSTVVGVLALSVGITSCGNESNVTAPESLRGQVVLEPAKQIDESGSTIADIAVAFSQAEEPQFTILVAALQAADLVDALSYKGQTTVFAPTDEAFAKLFSNPEFPYTAEQLLAPENRELLTTVLLYHTVPGKRLSESVLGSDEINMRAGGKVFPMLDGGSAYLMDGSDITPDARLLAEEGLIDVVASNGVIHVIDEVLLP